MLRELQQRLTHLAPDSVLALAAERLHTFYSRVLQRLALKYLSEAEAEDLVQDVWAKVLSRLRKSRALPPLGQRRWLETVLRDEAFDQLRTKCRRREQSLEQLTAAGQDFASPDIDPPEVADFYWNCAGVRAALEDARPDLGEQNYHIIRAHIFEGRPHADIAAELGLTEHQVRQHYSWAINKLRPRFQALFGKQGENC